MNPLSSLSRLVHFLGLIAALGILSLSCKAGVAYSDVFIWRTSSGTVTTHHHPDYRSLQVIAAAPTAVFGAGWPVGPDPLEDWVFDLAPTVGRPSFGTIRTYLINHKFATWLELALFRDLWVWRVSANGKVIVGMGTSQSGQDAVWVARAP